VTSAFTNKGPASIRKLLKGIPVHLIRSPDNALYGAAHCARRV
jgi:glucokinase